MIFFPTLHLYFVCSVNAWLCQFPGGFGWPSSEQFWLEVCAWQECKEPNVLTEASMLASEFSSFFFMEQNFMKT